MTGGESHVSLPSLDDAVRDVIEVERADCLRGPDSPEGREMGALVGANVASQRARRSFDLDTLAARSGIPADLLALLEEGLAVPSLRAVWAIATALRAPFGSLLAPARGAESVFRVQRAHRGRRITSASGGFRSRPLSPAGDPNAPEVYEVMLAPGCVEEAAAHAPDTFEHLVVVRGPLTRPGRGLRGRARPRRRALLPGRRAAQLRQPDHGGDRGPSRHDIRVD